MGSMGKQPQRAGYDVSLYLISLAAFSPFDNPLLQTGGLLLSCLSLSLPLTSLKQNRRYLAHCTNDDCKTFKGDTGKVRIIKLEL
jgi:hypothetical protein